MTCSPEAIAADAAVRQAYLVSRMLPVLRGGQAESLGRANVASGQAGRRAAQRGDAHHVARGGMAASASVTPEP